MSKVRINDLARELEVKSRPILDALEAIGVSGKTHSSSIETDQAERVREYFKTGGQQPLRIPLRPARRTHLLARQHLETGRRHACHPRAQERRSSRTLRNPAASRSRRSSRRRPTRGSSPPARHCRGSASHQPARATARIGRRRCRRAPCRYRSVLAACSTASGARSPGSCSGTAGCGRSSSGDSSPASSRASRGSRTGGARP